MNHRNSPVRARDTDREQAIEVLNAAYADGQLQSHEHSERLTRIQSALTLGELEADLADLQRRGDTPWKAPALDQSKAARRAALAAGGVAVAAILGTMVVPMLFGDDESAPYSQPLPSVVEPEEVEIVDPMSPEGFEIVLDAMRTQFGSTLAYEVYLHPDSASVVVPHGNGREVSYRLEGDTFVGADPGGPDEWDQVKDLARIDPNHFADALATATSTVESPESIMISVSDSWGPRDKRCFNAYARNAFDEAASLDFTCKGRLIRD